MAYVTGMVTRIHSGARRRLFLRDHRKAKGISADVMGGRLGMERESVLRLEREWATRCSPEKQAAYAAALQLDPEALWRPPASTEHPSLDLMVRDAPAEIKAMAADIVRRLVNKAG